MAEIYNYIIVIIKYDVGHCGSNPFFICGAFLGMVIEIIRDMVEKRESNRVRACLLGSCRTKAGRQKPQELVTSPPEWFAWHLWLTQEIIILKELLAPCPGSISSHCLCRVPGHGIAPRPFAWCPCLGLHCMRVPGDSRRTGWGREKRRGSPKTAGARRHFLRLRPLVLLFWPSPQSLAWVRSECGLPMEVAADTVCLSLMKDNVKPVPGHHGSYTAEVRCTWKSSPVGANCTPRDAGDPLQTPPRKGLPGAVRWMVETGLQRCLVELETDELRLVCFYLSVARVTERELLGSAWKLSTGSETLEENRLALVGRAGLMRRRRSWAPEAEHFSPCKAPSPEGWADCEGEKLWQFSKWK